MLCEVSKKTFEDFIDTYPKELFIKDIIDFSEKTLLFIDCSQEEENSLVAEERINLNTNTPISFRIKQVGA